MKLPLHANRDALAGLVFMSIGGLAFLIARQYPAGTLDQLGPGFFPRLLGGLLTLLGGAVLVRGLRCGQAMQGPWGLGAPVLLTIAILIFGASVERIGLVPALALLLLIAARAGREFRLPEVLLVVALLCLGAIAIFVWGLSLPYALFAWRF